MELLTDGGEHHEIGDGGWRRFALSGAPNGLQICPPKEEQGLAVALYWKNVMNPSLWFFLPEHEYMELELRSVEFQGAHEIGGRAQEEGAHPPRARPPISWAPWTSTDLNSNSISSISWRKNQRESFIAFYDTEPPPSPNLSQEG